ncbi:hypothetical protein DAEQUDRAFT_178607 [Daedalea quercina L-15889]|uniref:DUF6534 domain-containing protein n=1 Tax=Daedalea quercina L-15889 TaxID=1314783 RepID=A0A165RE21_9APHY|nr:hypothetical protein DAEQUDRAFT_178607 [Daedalea quercina L-15889]
MWVTALLVFNATTVLALSFGVAAKIFPAKTYGSLRHKGVSSLIFAALLDAVCGDILIATCLYVILRRHLNTTHSRTKHVVRTLITYSVETGATTSVCALACLITVPSQSPLLITFPPMTCVQFATMKHNCVFIALFAVLSKRECTNWNGASC